MPTIVFANPKGGAGKTTSALLLATELAGQGAAVAVLDADPERWISRWAERPGCPNQITVHGDLTEDTIVAKIDEVEREVHFVIIDLEGTASLMVAHAIGMADLVIIPTQGSSMDAQGSAKTIRLLRSQERMARRAIAHAVLLTRTSAAVTSRAMRNVQEQLEAADIPVFQVTLVERAAFRDLFDYGGSLDTLDREKVRNVDRAKENARAFAGEVLARLRQADKTEGGAS